MVRSASPPASRWPAVASEEVFPPQASAAGQARELVRRCYQGWNVSPTSLDDAVLVVDEAVANVIRHARTPLVVTVSFDGESLLLGVTDGVAASPRVRGTASDAETGRGLQIIDLLAAEWGVEQTAVGKRLWARLPANR
jgi:anti-sigma regulatory factor (Ser/Thr protein kinase)